MSYILNNAYYFLHIVKCYQQKQKKIINSWSKLELFNSYSVKKQGLILQYTWAFESHILRNMNALNYKNLHLFSQIYLFGKVPLESNIVY